MKKKLILLFAACLATLSFANAQDLNIEGTWKLLERNGQKVPELYSQIKLITSTHFMWVISDNQGNVMNGAGGTYTIEGNQYKESIAMVLPGMKKYYNYQPVFELSIDGNRMIQKGNMRDVQVTEIWEKIEPATTANSKDLNILGAWKMLERNGKAAAPEYYSFIKLFTSAHYMWMLADNQGNIVNGAGGTYTLEGSKFMGAISMVLPGMKTLYNLQTAYELSIDGNRMTQKGSTRDSEAIEIWEKIE